MKYVSEIVATNFAGRSFQYDLAPLTAIVGKNMRGKTSIAEAVRLGLLAYSPAHGNKPGLTWGFAGAKNGATSMGVRLHIDGVNYEHQWTKTKTGASYEGPGAICPPVLLDIKEAFLKLSGPKQIDYIFGKLDLSKLGYGKTDVIVKIKNGVKVPTATESSELALATVIEEVEELDRERADHKWTPQEWLDEVTETIMRHKQSAERTKEQMAGLIQGSTALKTEEGIKERPDPQKLKAAREQLALISAARNSVHTNAQQREDLETELRDLHDELEAYPDRATELEESRKLLAPTEAQIKEFKSGTEAATNDYHTLNAQHTEQATQERAHREHAQEILDQLKIDLEGSCCPRCKSKGKKWKESLQAFAEDEARKILAQANEVKKTVDRMAERLAELQGTVDRCKAEDAAQQTRQIEAQSLRKLIHDLDKYQTTRARLLRELEGAKERKLKLPAAPVYDAAEYDRLSGEVTRLESLERDSIATQSRATQTEEARQKHDRAAAELEVFTLALASLKEVKTEMMEKGFGAFLEKVNLFTHGLMKNAIEYREGDLGYWFGPHWVGLDHLSGTEKMLTLTGLAVALAQEAPVRLIIIDEWLRDLEMRCLVSERLAKLRADGVLDQVLIIDTVATGYKDLGYHVLEVK